MTTQNIFTDKFNGKQYRVNLKSYSNKVDQYKAGVNIWFDGSCEAGGNTGTKTFKCRKDLNSWLRMMGFKK